MELTYALLFLLAGFALLLVGGDALVKAAVSIAVRTKIPPAIISLTVIAAGTSAPELVTSVMAALDGKPDIAVGNVAGSNIFNILAILGLAFLITPGKSEKQKLFFEWASLLVLTIVTYFMITDLKLAAWEGGLLTASFVLLIGISVFRARKTGFTPDDDEEISLLKNPWLDAFYLFVGIAALVGGADLALRGGITLGQLAGWSEKMIGITIVSVGTGLPELAASAVAAYRGRSDIAVGNVLGSNIMNTLAVLGGTALITPLSIAPQILKVDIWALIAAILLTLPVILGLRFFVGRVFGTFFLGLYGVYIWGTLTNWQMGSF